VAKDDMADDGRIYDMFNDTGSDYEPNLVDSRPKEVIRFLELLRVSKKLLHEHTIVSTLAFVTRRMDIKSKFTF
jgi:hypothetical protein